MKNIWLLVGRETEGNKVKNYMFMNYIGGTQVVQKRSLLKFCREHNVLNVQINGDSITGKGMNITSLPRYVNQKGIGLKQVSGISQQEVLNMAQPLINQYIQKSENEKQKKYENSNEAQKSKQTEYVVKKLITIEDLLITALAMKDITNELASNEHITRYIKQIDIDNAEGDKLDNLIRYNGVIGLANGLSDRLDKIKVRIQKHKLDKTYINQVYELKSLCEKLKKIHSETKNIIKNNKMQEKEHSLLLNKKSKSIDDIPIIDDTNDMVPVDMYEENMIGSDIPVVDFVESEGIVVEQYDYSDISAIEDIFSKPEETEEEKKIREEVNKICEAYSGAVTAMGNIIHNAKRVSEIAYSLDMKYSGIHKRILKDNINSHYNSEEEIIKDISEHYDKITSEPGNIYNYILANSLGNYGKEVGQLLFKNLSQFEKYNDFNKNDELFEHYISILINKIVEQLNIDKEQCIKKALQNFTKVDNKEMIRNRMSALIDLRNVLNDEIVFQAFERSCKYKNLTTYEKELTKLESLFGNGEFTISYVNNESLHMHKDMQADEIRNIVNRYDAVYNNIKNSLKNIKQRFKGSGFELKDNPYHPGDFINYMYCIHSEEISNQTESMCNNGGWDFVTARSNARRNIINKYYTDDNTRTYYDTCNELIKNFNNIYG